MPTITFEEELKELFTDLHHSKLFADGKEIADAELIVPPAEVLTRYRQEKDKPSFDLLDFYRQYFKKAPEQTNEYVSDTTKPVQDHINKLWGILARQPQEQVNYTSLLPLPHPYIVPGGRFNEIYYWDSYFTMLGLQVSGKVDMIESMIDNFTYLINTVGFIPNGNRSYFSGRSQPPFYALMVDLLAQSRGDTIYIKYLPALVKEYQFWMDTHTDEKSKAIKRVVELGEGQFLNRYYDNINRPRTEMYLDDVELIEQKGEKYALQLILDIRAACESGWDFSARWCHDFHKLETIHTSEIIPSDLNALLYFLEKTIAKAYRLDNNTEQSQSYEDKANQRKQLINSLLWNNDTHFYHDYDFVAQQHTQALTLAGIFPLYFKIASPYQAAACATMIRDKFLKAGGVVSTPYHSGQQWDAPNGWAPLQWMTIQGLRNYGFDDLANKIKERWVALNTKVFKATGKLMEKYNVEDIGLESGGGEYPVQDGFGWTNGVLLKLLSE